MTHPPTRRVRVGSQVRFELAVPTPAVLQMQPRVDGTHRILRQAWETVPEIPLHQYRDLYGNVCYRATMPAGSFRVGYDALVEVPGGPDEVVPDAAQTPVEELPDEVLLYTLPSRYILSDVLSNTAWELFGSVPAGWARVQAICDWVHEHIRFQFGTSNPLTTALDVYERRVGVCRDMTQLGITFCRALNIPARYVFGYLPDIGVPPPYEKMDFAAWFEAYVDGRWRTFDPRNNTPRIGRIVIGRGRDALDVAMVTTYGQVDLRSMVVWANEVQPAASASSPHPQGEELVGANVPPTQGEGRVAVT
jgi:transglutaminase-like putative cysteine protease